MKSVLLFFVFTATYVAAVQGVSQNDVMEKVGGADFSFKKKGGELKIGRKGKKLWMKIGSIVELNENGVQIGGKIDFENVTFRFEKTKNDSTLGVQAAVIKMIAELNGKTIEMIWYAFREDGTITGEDGNEYNVRKGSIKMNLKYDITPYNASVIYREFDLLTKCGKGTKKPEKDNKRKGGRKGGKSKSKRDIISSRVCDYARITFSPSYRVGSTWEDMPEGFPEMLPIQKAYGGVKLRFKVGSIFYDPVTEVGDDIDEPYPGDTSTANRAVGATSLLLLLGSFLIKLVVV
ncbi:uncharacterized protein LOC130636997 [Hydractinia symbiolongicarpus]|uniref:uncharacterized protein LOC130635755 n=1 Tax=Hydractinia symbiolongicarpus TaxID=13093 RepID=UPI00254ED0FA|nr:uncharacterized protein LOC130635755 [Hydractinia symbiolongicarpus]XP_057302838.1 uncharacterized protein LOC130636997 [Hydractinia symbiolongicarpus]